MSRPERLARESRRGRAGVASPGFLGLLATQLLGAANDNAFRWLVIGLGKHYVQADQQALVLAVGTAAFVVPYLLLAAPAGYLADRFSKRQVIVACKAAEIGIMLAGVAAIGLQNLPLMLAVLCVMGAQSALFGPAKYGSIPEIVHPDRISAANGLMGLATVGATVLGAAAGLALYGQFAADGLSSLKLSAAVLVGTAFVGWLASLLVPRLTPAAPERRFPWDAARQTARDLGALAGNRALLRVALGSAFFWSLGTLAQLNVDQFGLEGRLAQDEITPLLIALVIGVGSGSVLAGVWSGGKVELGILPLGAAGVCVSGLLLFAVTGPLVDGDGAHTASFSAACVGLLLLGVSAGLFEVPLSSYLQHRSPHHLRGSILAASNFLTFLGILLSSGLYYVLRGGLSLSARSIFLLAALATIPVLVYVVWLLPQATIRFLLWLATRTIYRVRIEGPERLPDEGGALLAPNHVSWVDGLLLLTSTSRPVRMLVYGPYAETKWLRGLARLMGVIPVHPGRPKQIKAALDAARQALLDGELVCIFPEGSLTRTGQLQGFKPGLLNIVAGTGIPVIPVYLDGLWGSIFSFERGRFFWKWPRTWPYPLSIRFGPRLAEPEKIDTVRRAVQELGALAVQQRQGSELVPPRRFLRMCREQRNKPKLADSMGTELTGGDALLRALILRRILLREVLAPDEKYVGLLLPPSVGGALANAALPLAGRIPVNLNYTVSSAVMNACIAQCGIRHVLTSRRAMEKFQLELDAELVYLEDFKDRVRLSDKLAAFALARLCPLPLLERWLGVRKLTPDDTLTVIFTSGSTGDPKGVVLTNRNIASNVHGIDQAVSLKDHDVLLGVLPFFHSFGFTATLWTVLNLSPKGVYHFSPLDAREIGKQAGKHRATILMSTPTFLRSYLKRCSQEEFSALELVVAGAEKLPRDLSDAFEQRFGVRPIEGYGTTELSPLVSVNVPPARSRRPDLVLTREGSVGRPIADVEARIVHPETGEPLGVDDEGMLLIRGPNVMQGYLHKPEATAQVIRDGWYVTGDMARIDADGFIFITGRLSRFSKIGGEMVPHIKIEELLQELVSGDADELKIAVTAVPDPRKGERLIVLHAPLAQSPEALCKSLAAAGLPNLFIPGADSFREVPAIPVLGSGKLDLRRLKELALELFPPAAG